MVTRRSFARLLLLVLFINIGCCYWLSQSKLDWYSAQTFCQHECHSELASIHSEDNATKIENLLNDDTYITINMDTSAKVKRTWIGLYLKSKNTWGWSDNSLLDWNQDLWDSDVANEDCALMDTGSASISGWDDQPCDYDYRFLCNECEGVLDKYIEFPYNSEQHANASNICVNEVGTSLASVHNADDMDSISYLCPSGCWIGLVRINDSNAWQWSDDTYFDFGNDVSGGVWPWYNSDPEPSMAGIEDCVLLQGDDEWIDFECAETRRFICNKPNEFCYDDRWEIMLPYAYNNNNITFKDCMLYMDDDSIAVISNRKWDEHNVPLKIELIVEIHNVIINTNESEVGLIIVHENNASYYDLCDGVFIGLSFENDKTNFKFATPYNEYKINISIDQSIYHRLTVDMSLSSMLYAQIDNISITPFPINDSGLIFSSKAIGIRNRNANITAKSLFVSGTPQYTSINTIFPCLSETTDETTNNPTLDSTEATTEATVDETTNNPTLTSTEATDEATNNPTLAFTEATADETTNNPTLASAEATTEATADTTADETTHNHDNNPETSFGLDLEDEFVVSQWVIVAIAVIFGLIMMCLIWLNFVFGRSLFKKKKVKAIADVNAIALGSVSIHSIDNITETDTGIGKVNVDKTYNRYTKSMNTDDKIVTEGKDVMTVEGNARGIGLEYDEGGNVYKEGIAMENETEQMVQLEEGEFIVEDEQDNTITAR